MRAVKPPNLRRRHAGPVVAREATTERMRPTSAPSAVKDWLARRWKSDEASEGAMGMREYWVIDTDVGRGRVTLIFSLRRQAADVC